MLLCYHQVISLFWGCLKLLPNFSIKSTFCARLGVKLKIELPLTYYQLPTWIPHLFLCLITLHMWIESFKWFCYHSLATKINTMSNSIFRWWKLSFFFTLLILIFQQPMQRNWLLRKIVCGTMLSIFFETLILIIKEYFLDWHISYPLVIFIIINQMHSKFCGKIFLVNCCIMALSLIELLWPKKSS